MRKNFIILLFTLFSILASFSYANGGAYKKYAVFVWDRDTAYYYGKPEILVRPKYNSEKEAVQILKKEFVRVFKEEDGIDVKATDYLVWDSNLEYIVVMGENKKTGKWEAFTKPEATDENVKILINKCSETCNNCNFIWSN
ncbi:hypothetical protein KST17_05260 [Fusobacterium canifelinum]|uniref:hypothetical protein n=1 Tax=Fusobacterium canifelinum TaxID=285729 RepID=UPI0030D13FCD